MIYYIYQINQKKKLLINNPFNHSASESFHSTNSI